MIRWSKCKGSYGVGWYGEERWLGSVLTEFTIVPAAAEPTRYLLTVRLSDRLGQVGETYNKTFATVGAAKGWVTKHFR